MIYDNLTDEDVKILVYAINRGNRTYSERQIEEVLSWANDAKKDSRILRMVLDGDLTVGISLVAREIVFVNINSE